MRTAALWHKAVHIYRKEAVLIEVGRVCHGWWSGLFLLPGVADHPRSCKIFSVGKMFSVGKIFSMSGGKNIADMACPERS